MNAKAAALADDHFYGKHLGLVDPVTKKRRPLSLKPKDAALRNEWLASYKTADEAEKNGFSTCDVGGLLTRCPAPPVAVSVVAPPVVTPPSCSVSIKALKLSSLGYHHMLIVFNDGSGKEYYLRGGPGGNPGGLSASSGELSGGSSNAGSVGSSRSTGNTSNSSGSSGSSASSGSSHASGSNPSASSDSSRGGAGPFGNIVTQYGEYLPGTVDYDPTAKSTLIESGPGSCSKYAELMKQMDKISASKTRYSPLGPNSNSAAFTAMKNAGMTPVAPDDVWVPGAEMIINTK